MQSIQLKSTVDAEGKLTIQFPQELANQELDLVIVYQSSELQNLEETYQEKTAEELGYPPDFFKKTAGVIKDETLVRGD